MVDILIAVLTDGLPAVEAACAEALAHGVHSAAHTARRRSLDAVRACGLKRIVRNYSYIASHICSFYFTHKITDLAALLPWNWRRAIPVSRAA